MIKEVYPKWQYQRERHRKRAAIAVVQTGNSKRRTMYRARSVMSRSFRIMCAWNVAIMTESLWPRRLNENLSGAVARSQLIFCGGSFVFLIKSSCKNT